MTGSPKTKNPSSTNLDNARRNKAGHDWPIGKGECIRGHPAKHWRPKGDPTRQGGALTKGYCRWCRRENEWKKQGLIS